MSYRSAMNAEVILEENTRYDRGGKPLEVVIPYEKFIDFIESYGLDLTEEERNYLLGVQADIKAGRSREFISSEEAKRQLGL